ncbi:MAG: Replication regulatory protein RepB [Bacteriophage sp.]|nr:MAG: Replication regulatory protein RepB [Bacteriophage sp.]
MPISEAKKRNNANYTAKCDYINIRPLKPEGAKIRAAAENAGQSLQGYILQAIRERMERDGLPIDQPAADEEEK